MLSSSSAAFLALLLTGRAFAYGTEPQQLMLSEEVALMEGAVYETGYVPSGSPVMVNFALEAEQLASVHMGTMAWLEWPEAVTLVWESIPESGWLGLFGELSTAVYLKLDLWGYEGEWELDRQSIDVRAETVFDPLVLSDSVPDVVTIDEEGTGDTLISYDFTVLEVVQIILDVDLAATMATSMAGLEITHDDQVQSLQGETVVLEVPDNGYIELESTYVASWDTAMQVLIQPGVEVCVDILGCYEWDDVFDIPVDMGSNAFEDPFFTNEYEFLLPVMTPPDESYDFGEVLVGNLANWNVELLNGGVELLMGEAGITGSEYFAVYPDFVLADAESYDGLVVSFGPETPGEFGATLLLATNDPAHPTYSIELTGIGIEDVDDEINTIPAEVGCQCSSGRAAPSPWAVALLGFASLALVRRRSQEP
jgi:MYXO-CTERM domain-containing protein